MAAEAKKDVETPAKVPNEVLGVGVSLARKRTLQL